MPFRDILQRIQNRLSRSSTSSRSTKTTSKALQEIQSTGTPNGPATSIMATAPVALILGAGPRIGTAVSEAFAANGYKVALAARKGTDAVTENGSLSLKADFNDPESIPAIFKATVAQFGAAPSVIIYNAAALTPPTDGLFSIPAAKLAADLNVNTISPYTAAQEAVNGWSKLQAATNKVFIYTGNMQNSVIVPVPMMMNLGVGKAASAAWIGAADAAYAAQGYRFIYADERHADGKMKGMALDGEAHAEFYTQLAKSTEGIPWDATFVKGQGHVSFK